MSVRTKLMVLIVVVALPILDIFLPYSPFSSQASYAQEEFPEDKNKPVFRFANQFEHISGNLYRSGNGAWHSIILVTSEGIVLVDPLNNMAAEWTKQQLESRFNVPVRYIIYSHSHFDHVEGAAVFGDDISIIGHEKILQNMDGRFPQLPGDMIDRNLNGLIDREDIMIPTDADPGICGMSASFFDQYDRNGDGIMTPAELQQDILPPTLTYSNRMTLKLGGETLELLHPGTNHANDQTIVYFPKEKVVFAADMIADALVREDIRSLPSACGPYDGSPIDEWINSYKAVLDLDFTLFAGGHGDYFTKEEASLPLQFLQDLRKAVEQGMAAGMGLEQLQQEITLPQYSQWYFYERLLKKNIHAMYSNLQQYR
jgi:glyoxylase-like metal-dependent hydrolase (beta-lactamase superfamily II)